MTALQFGLLIFAALAAGAGLVISLVLLFGREKQDNTRESENLRKDLREAFSANRREINSRLDSIQRSLMSSVSEGIKSGNEVQREGLLRFSSEMETRFSDLKNSQQTQLENIRKTTEDRISSMQKSNQDKLSEIQTIVDEKLQKTLNERVAESFQLVGQRLEEVYKGLGEMQSLATGVGDLKKILSNVKTRGIFGEIQLSRILEQILTKDQYAENIATKKGSRDVVEFAVCLPAKNQDGSPVYLPIDSKFPLDAYSNLTEAADSGDAVLFERASKDFENAIKKNAKDIRDKYIDPPNTTDFALMFLPTEGLYSEVTKRTSLITLLAQDFHVSIVGPSTLSAFLNSLQMGFRTLAIEKRSYEVWNLLSAVKTEFEKFGGALQTVKKRLESAEKDLNDLVGTRTNAMLRRLRDVQALPDDEASDILDLDPIAAQILPGDHSER